jgi:hypothetical protein
MTRKHKRLVEIIKRNNLMEGHPCVDDISFKCNSCVLKDTRGNTCSEAAKKYLDRMKNEVEKLEILMAIYN